MVDCLEICCASQAHCHCMICCAFNHIRKMQDEATLGVGLYITYRTILNIGLYNTYILIHSYMLYPYTNILGITVYANTLYRYVQTTHLYSVYPYTHYNAI